MICKDLRAAAHGIWFIDHANGKDDNQCCLFGMIQLLFDYLTLSIAFQHRQTSALLHPIIPKTPKSL